MALRMALARRRASRGFSFFVIVIASAFLGAYFIIFYEKWTPNIDQTGRQKPYERPTLRPRDKLPRVLILTLLHNSEKKLPHYFELVKSLTYPKELISLVFGEDNSKDSTVEVAENGLQGLHGFWRTEFRHLGALEGKHKGWGTEAHSKHYRNIQYKRRRHLALARNLLLSHALYDEEYVLWLDSDLEEFPKDLIEQLLQPDKDIIVPNSLIRYRGNVIMPYDLSNWRETQASLAFQASQKPEYLFLEGYKQQRPKRTYLNDLKREGKLVQLDGVGSCVILIKSIHLRLGLTYPSYVFMNQIETEGMAKMAAAMDLDVWGLPYLEVFHACDFESAHWTCPL
jgi:glycosyltransferase involved in cell wall biosynthesis